MCKDRTSRFYNWIHNSDVVDPKCNLTNIMFDKSSDDKLIDSRWS